MSRLPVVDSDNDSWGTVLNDFLGVSHNSDGTLKQGRADVAVANAIRTSAISTSASVATNLATAQAEVDALAAVGGGVLLFGPGDFPLQGLILKTGVTLRTLRAMRGYIPGTSQASTKFTANATGWVIDTTGGATQCLGAAVDGIDIAGSGTATGGIRFRNADACAIRNVQLHNFVDQAIQLDSSSSANVLEDILITQGLQNTGRGSAAGAVEIAGNDNLLSRVEASCSQSALTSASLFNNAYYISGTNNFLVSTVGEFADRGYLNTGSRNRYTSTRADRVFGHGYEITNAGGSNTFVGCHAVDIGQETTNTYDGFRISSTSNSFAGCFVSKAASNFPKYAFNDSVSNSTITSRNDYAGCRGVYTTAMFNVDGFLGSSPSIPAHPMRPADATASIDVTGTSFLVFAAYTTPTTVTAFTNGTVGQRLYLLGDADVTIQNNSSIKTSTGANKALAANRAYCYIHYNGVWYEVGP